MKRRLAIIVSAAALGALAPLGLVTHSAQAEPADHIWFCVGVEPPVDVSYCQHNPWAYPPLNGQTPDVPPVPVPAPPL